MKHIIKHKTVFELYSFEFRLILLDRITWQHIPWKNRYNFDCQNQKYSLIDISSSYIGGLHQNGELQQTWWTYSPTYPGFTKRGLCICTILLYLICRLGRLSFVHHVLSILGNFYNKVIQNSVCLLLPSIQVCCDVDINTAKKETPHLCKGQQPEDNLATLRPLNKYHTLYLFLIRSLHFWFVCVCIYT